jgi:formate-dependent nitrite reductase cytochrome c552 subunit|tara:strand:- start:408 stop:632 length:225 start_codon:yes stop_codon:yes gene_type:complete
MKTLRNIASIPEPLNTYAICKECGSKDVEQLEWRKANTGEFNGVFADDTNRPNNGNSQWCCDCEEHVEFEEHSK